MLHFPVLSAVGVQGMEDYTIPGVETLQLYLLDTHMVQCTLTCTSLSEKFILVVFAVMTELLCEVFRQSVFGGGGGGDSLRASSLRGGGREGEGEYVTNPEGVCEGGLS